MGRVSVDVTAIERAFPEEDEDSVWLRVAAADTSAAEIVLTEWVRVFRALPGVIDEVGVSYPMALPDGSHAICLDEPLDRETYQRAYQDLLAALARASFDSNVGIVITSWTRLNANGPGTFHEVGVSLAPRLIPDAATQAMPNWRVTGGYGVLNRRHTAPDSLEGLADYALRWCHLPGGEHHVSRDLLSLRLEGQDRELMLRQSISHPSSMVAMTANRWPAEGRGVQFESTGRVLFQFGNGTTPPPAAKSIAQVNELFDHLAPYIYSAFTLRLDSYVIGSDSLIVTGWPNRPPAGMGILPKTRQLDASRMWDAYGLMYLGPEYAEFTPDPAQYDTRELNGGRVLTHRSAEEWFAGATPDEAALQAARTTLQPILLTQQEVETYRSQLKT